MKNILSLTHTFVISSFLLGSFAMAADPKTTKDQDAAIPKVFRVYLGTYTGNGKSEGIYTCQLDLLSGKISSPRLASKAVNPSFLAIHPTLKWLYAVSEVEQQDGKKTGGIAAFAIDPKTGNLTELNRQASGGAGPCHLVVGGAGKNVLVANYSGGSIAVLPLAEDGKLEPASSVIQHEGSSVNRARQEKPHAHSINVDANNNFVFAADLGADKVFVYKFGATTGSIAPNDPPAAKLAPGSGPRHFAFHPSGRYAYVINELLSTITAFRYDPDAGVLTELQTISTLPADFKGENTTAEVQVHPSGKFLYGSNRGHNSIAMFTIDERTGELEPIGHQSTQGKTPRNFGVDPTGQYLLAANQDSDTVVAFRVNADSGKLEPTGQVLDVPMCVCVKFVPLDE